MSSFALIDIVRILLILVLVYLAYIDIRTFLLPNAITYPMIAVGLILNCFPHLGFTNFLNAIVGAIVGYAFLWGLNFAYHLAKKQNGIGMGDAKLLAALGAFLGASALPEILLLASISGLIGGVLWLRFQKQPIRMAFPFGPFLAFAGIIELLWPQILQTWFLSTPI